MLFSKQKNGAPDIMEDPPRTTDDPEIRRQALDQLQPAKLERIENTLRSYGTDGRLTEEEVVCAAAASRHAHQPVLVSFIIAAVGVAVAIGVGLVAIVRPQEGGQVAVLFGGGIVGTLAVVGGSAGPEVWRVGDTAAVREIITIRREAGTLSTRLTEEP